VSQEVLIAGGAGFIGSTIASACQDVGITPVILDDLSAGRPEFVANRIFYHGDIADDALVREIFSAHPRINLVVHCAARIIVPESVQDPLGYYQNNVAKTMALLETLSQVGCRRLIFSSSASIYAQSPTFTVDETSPIAPNSPYAWTKAIVEQVLDDLARAGQFRSISLRYFNPIGADPAMRTGQQRLAPSHALGRLVSVYRAGGEFEITGTDWPPRDGSGIRDYIHVWDLAQAHVSAIECFEQVTDRIGPQVAINLGTGTGTTVRELVRAFERVTGQSVPLVFAGRRAGDTAGSYALSSRSHELLGWRAQRSLEEGIADSIRWAELFSKWRSA